MRNTDRKKVGRLGEDAACVYLIQHGHTVIKRNWRGSHTEIDIISLDARGVHFVEVKTRTAPVMADPEVNVGPAKQKTLVKSAMMFLKSKDREYLSDCEVFFDILTVVLDGDDKQIQFYPQAFIPIYV